MGKSARKKTAPKFKISKTLQRALDDFPRLVKEEERVYKEQQKDIARFDKMIELMFPRPRRSALKKKRS